VASVTPTEHAMNRPKVRGSEKQSRLRRAVLGLTLLASVACSEGTGGACHIIYLDPLFTISSVRSAITNNPVPEVRISDVRIDNVPVPVTFLSEVTVAHDVVPEGDQLLCVIECGFAATPGTYQFTVSSAGYRDTTITMAADYTRTESSCPVRVSQGVQLTLNLNPL